MAELIWWRDREKGRVGVWNRRLTRYIYLQGSAAVCFRLEVICWALTLFALCLFFSTPTSESLALVIGPFVIKGSRT